MSRQEFALTAQTGHTWRDTGVVAPKCPKTVGPSENNQRTRMASHEPSVEVQDRRIGRFGGEQQHPTLNGMRMQPLGQYSTVQFQRRRRA